MAMASTDPGPVGAPCWVDLASSDTQVARDFYGRVLGWQAEEPNEDFGGYFNFKRDGQLVAGCMPAMAQGPGEIWSVYLRASDAAASVAEAKALGAQVVVDAIEVADLGTMAVLTDPSGAAIGLWQPGTHKGFGLVEKPGTPVWFELRSRSYDQSVAFYQALFGLGPDPMPATGGPAYTVLSKDDRQVAGVMDASDQLPAGAPSHWSIYFEVADTDMAVATVEEMGGNVLRPAEDTPFGRMATVADPLGAQFQVMARAWR